MTHFSRGNESPLGKNLRELRALIVHLIMFVVVVDGLICWKMWIMISTFHKYLRIWQWARVLTVKKFNIICIFHQYQCFVMRIWQWMGGCGLPPWNK